MAAIILDLDRINVPVTGFRIHPGPVFPNDHADMLALANNGNSPFSPPTGAKLPQFPTGICAGGGLNMCHDY